MKTLAVEVRTNYTIQVEFKDFCEAKEKWINENSAERIMYKSAFNNTDMTHETLKREFKEFRPHGDRCGLIANVLGFDGWSCGLLYHNEKLTIGVYKNGDALN